MSIPYAALDGHPIQHPSMYLEPDPRAPRERTPLEEARHEAAVLTFRAFVKERVSRLAPASMVRSVAAEVYEGLLAMSERGQVSGPEDAEHWTGLLAAGSLYARGVRPGRG